MTTIYLFDPVTAEFTGKVNNAVAFPVNSTHVPAMEGTMFPQYFVDGQWTFDNPNTPEVELPVIDITNISISNATLGGNIWSVDTKAVATLTAKMQIPENQFTAIVEKVVNDQVTEDLRFRATITALPADPDGNLLTMPLYFETSGNYVIRPERLNKGLESIGAPFRVNFPLVDIDALVAIPT